MKFSGFIFALFLFVVEDRHRSRSNTILSNITEPEMENNEEYEEYLTVKS